MQNAMVAAFKPIQAGTSLKAALATSWTALLFVLGSYREASQDEAQAV